MSAPGEGVAPGAPGGELDELIGDLVAEAARRRAAPDWPADDEARIHHELRVRAPRHSGAPPISDLVTSLEREAAALAGAPEHPRAGGRRRRRSSGAETNAALAGVFLAAAAALRSVAERLELLEQQVRSMNGATRGTLGSTPPDPPSAAGRSGLPDMWLQGLASALAGTTGRVCYADADAEAVVAKLRAGGVDAYGVVEPGDASSGAAPDTADVRRGQLLEHLASLQADALGALILVGPPDRMTGASFRDLVAASARTSGAVLLVSESPWSWRARLGSSAELADRRPLSLDAWMAALADAGFQPRVELAADGASYLVVAHRAP